MLQSANTVFLFCYKLINLVQYCKIICNWQDWKLVTIVSEVKEGRWKIAWHQKSTVQLSAQQICYKLQYKAPSNHWMFTQYTHVLRFEPREFLLSPAICFLLHSNGLVIFHSKLSYKTARPKFSCGANMFFEFVIKSAHVDFRVDVGSPTTNTVDWKGWFI